MISPDRLRDPAAVERFEREMRAVGKVEHLNIVRATDAGEVDGTHFLVMKYVPGQDLSRLVQRLGRLDVADACEVIRQAAMGLQHAHDLGLVHRDIKPSNLMLTVGGLHSAASESCTTDAPAALIKILDLGLALLAERHEEGDGLTTTGQTMGTLEYMAPEQGMDSHDVDIRAHIYSLGATLYRLLCGEAPFPRRRFDTPLKLVTALATRDPPSINEHRDVPESFVALVDRMLSRLPADRPTTPREVADTLLPFAEGNNLAALASDVSGVVNEHNPRSASPAHAGVHEADSLGSTQDQVTSAAVETVTLRTHESEVEVQANDHHVQRFALLAAIQLGGGPTF